LAIAALSGACSNNDKGNGVTGGSKADSGTGGKGGTNGAAGTGGSKTDGGTAGKSGSGAGGAAVTYDANGAPGGSVPVDSNRYVSGQTVTALANTGNLVYTGYSFVGWQTKADGSGTTYAQGQTFKIGTADVTLYALWAGGYAYAVNHNGGSAGTIAQYTIGPNGALTPMFKPTVLTGGNDPRYIAVDPLGKYVYVSNISSNTVAQFTIGADGSLTAMSTPTILMGDVTGGKLYYPSGIAVHPKSPYAYVALQQKSSVNQFTVGADGTLSALTPSTVTSGDPTNGANGPVSIAIDPSGNWAYVANGASLTVSQYKIGADGTLSALTPFLVATGGVRGSGTAFDVKIVSTSSGAYAYVTNYADGTVAQYSINPTSGILSPLTPSLISAGTYAFSIAVHPTGKFAYVTILTGSPDAAVAQFTIDQTTGAFSAMTPPTVSAGGAGAAVITVEASGKYAYATSGETGWGSSSIAQYNIDQDTGALTLMNNPTVQTSGTGPGGIVTVGK
jgi:6-phosphogluconolactonase (cycloisomerase 2 family)